MKTDTVVRVATLAKCSLRKVQNELDAIALNNWEPFDSIFSHIHHLRNRSNVVLLKPWQADVRFGMLFPWPRQETEDWPGGREDADIAPCGAYFVCLEQVETTAYDGVVTAS